MITKMYFTKLVIIATNILASMGFSFAIYLYESIFITYDYKLFYCNKELFIHMLPVCRDKV